MKPKVVEVITHILESLNNNVSLEELNQSLLKSKEYDPQTIGIAFSLIYDKIFLKKKKDSKDNNRKKSIRILSEEEMENLGIDNYNYLLHLSNLGLIDADNFENLLEQINYFPENKLTLHLYSSDSVN